MSISSRKCQSYRSGHQTHWIAAIKVYAETPRISATIELATSGGFEVSWLEKATGKEIGLRTEIWFHHEPNKLKAILSGAKGHHKIELVKGTHFLVVDKGNSSIWFNMSTEPLTPCI